MFSKSPFTVIVLSTAGVSAALLLYLLYKRNDDGFIRKGRKSRNKCTVKLPVPQECVSAVIGRGGSKINDIQNITNTKINLENEDENEKREFRMCFITGTAEGAQLAKCLIESAMRNQPVIETYEMLVPNEAGGRIIGRRGMNIRSITGASNAKVTVVPANESASLKVTIIGTAEQIELAKLMIEEKVNEELEMRRRIEEGEQRRSPRRTTRNTSADSQSENNGQGLASEREGFMKVYISAMENPGRFWMQVFGPRTVDLDQLIEQMTEFYSKEENRKLHIITEPYVDQMVAAPFGNDGKWYRAKITNVDQNVENVQLVIYYVDYGDSTQLFKEQVFSLQSDFLMVRHHAIECTLAHVKPKNNMWSEEATEIFDKLCHCAQWKTIMAKIKSYRERERGQREGSPIPVVELYGKNGSKEVSIGKELVRQGYAEELNDGECLDYEESDFSTSHSYRHGVRPVSKFQEDYLQTVKLFMTGVVVTVLVQSNIIIFSAGEQDF